MKNWPRSRKLALASLILLLSTLVIFSMSNWPSPTLEIAIRRQEQQQLIGPGEIIEKLDFAGSSWDHLIICKTEYGYTTYEFQDTLGWDNGYLRYFEKTPGATLFTTDYRYEQGLGDPWLPIFVFPQNPAAYSARMILTIQGAESTADFNLQSYREPGSCFMFRIPAGPELDGECYWLLQQAITGAWQEYVVAGNVEIHLNFYNSQGNLVDTYSKSVTK